MYLLGLARMENSKIFLFFFFLQITIQFIDKIITSDNHLDLSGAAHMQLVLHTTAITSAHQISDPKLCFSLDQ